MAFLFGDATLSPLRSNFIAFLPDALDFAIKLLQADELIHEGAARLRTLEQAADAEIAKLEVLARTIAEAAEPARAATDAPTGRCADAISRAAGDLARAEADRVRQELAAERARIDAQAADARAACVVALEALVTRHDLPDMTTELRLTQQDGARYEARLLARTPWGLDLQLDLDVPPAHPLAHVVRIDKMVERLEVQAPEEGGWLRKEVKLRPQRLDKGFLSELILGAEETTLRLRAAADGSGAGFDVSVRGRPANARVVRVGDDALPPFELAEVDAERVLALADKLAGLCEELKPQRRALVEARLDEATLRSIESPRVVVERLLAAIAPIVREIDERSLAPAELVLKRLLGDGRREEIFISKQVLRQRLEPLPPSLRPLFAPLRLFDGGAPPPPPAPRARTLEVDADEASISIEEPPEAGEA